VGVVPRRTTVLKQIAGECGADVGGGGGSDIDLDDIFDWMMSKF
jgi:hypothetical protein